MLENLDSVDRVIRGQQVVMNPTFPRNGISPPRAGADPDQFFDGSNEIWDIFAPESGSSLFQIVDGAAQKVQSGQTQRISIVLDRSGVTIGQLDSYFNDILAVPQSGSEQTWRQAIDSNAFGTVHSDSGSELVEISVLDRGTRTQLYLRLTGG